MRVPVEHQAGVRKVGSGSHDETGTVQELGLVVDPARRRRIRSCSEGGCSASGEPGRAAAPARVPARRGGGTGAPAPPLAGPLDETGEVGHDELGLVVEPHHAEVRLEGGEGVVGDLGLGGRDGGDERGLPDAREAHEGHVGHQLELQSQPALLAELALLGEGRGPDAGWTGTGRCRDRPALPRRPASGRQGGGGRPASVPSWSRTIVPSGTGTSRSVPPRPCLRLPWPWVPLLAARWGWSRKAIREATLRSTTSHTSPPSPPSPPSGPPKGTWASRRKLDRAGAAVAALDVETALVDELRHLARLPTRHGVEVRLLGEVDRVALDPGLPGGHVLRRLA